MSPWRCAEPTWLKNRKLKTVDPELLCKDVEAISHRTGNNTSTFEPIPLRGKADTASVCHTYLFPHMRMDCSKRGKFNNGFLWPKQVWLPCPEPPSRHSCHSLWLWLSEHGWFIISTAWLELLKFHLSERFMLRHPLSWARPHLAWHMFRFTDIEPAQL